MGVEGASFNGFVNDESLWNLFWCFLCKYYRNRPILKTLGQFQNLGFAIMSTRENIRLIARTPFRPRPPLDTPRWQFTPNEISYSYQFIPFWGLLGDSFIYFFIQTWIESSVRKQWRPCSDAAFCCVWSRSALFAYVPQKGRFALYNIWSRGQTNIYGLFCEFVAPPGRKTWLLFSVRDMSWGLENPCFTKFSVVSIL